MVLTQPGIHAQQVSLPVVLLLEIFRRLDARHAAEVVLADHPNAEVFRFPLLVTFFGVRTCLSTDDDERGFGGYLIGRRAAEADDECLGFLPAER